MYTKNIYIDWVGIKNFLERILFLPFKENIYLFFRTENITKKKDNKQIYFLINGAPK